jgi:hypothetical protein
MVQGCEGEDHLGLEKRCPFEGKKRTTKYGWNGYEYAYDEAIYLCDDCATAIQPITNEG